MKLGTAVTIKGAELAVGAAVAQTGIGTIAEATGVAGGQAALGAASKVGSNALQGKPFGKDVGAAAATSAAVGTLGHYLAGRVGDNAAAAIAAKVSTSLGKKEGTCIVTEGHRC